MRLHHLFKPYQPPQVYIPPPDWSKLDELNAKRRARGAPEMKGSEYAEFWAEWFKPQPKPRKMTRKEVEHVQNWLRSHDREPLSAQDIFELVGVDHMTLANELDAIENAYQEAIRKGESEIAHWQEYGLPVPDGAHDKMVAAANAARDTALQPIREKFFTETVPLIRGAHNAIRWEARVAAMPEVPPATVQRMSQLLKGCRSRRDVEKLHAECLAAKDEPAAYWLEANAAAEMEAADATMWQSIADAQRTRRAATQIGRIVEDEQALQTGLALLNQHPTSTDRQNLASSAGIKDVNFLPADTQAMLQLPPAEPVF